MFFFFFVLFFFFIFFFFFFFFFFQAEDGIRDFHVTGVQTCALPIFVCFRRVASRSRKQTTRWSHCRSRSWWSSSRGVRTAEDGRSEERRVGKECRCRWWADE